MLIDIHKGDFAVPEFRYGHDVGKKPSGEADAARADKSYFERHVNNLRLFFTIIARKPLEKRKAAYCLLTGCQVLCYHGFGDMMNLQYDYRFQPVRYYSLNYTFFDMELHTHPEFEIMYIQSGRCRAVISGEDFSLKKGEMVYIDGHVPHKLTVNKDRPCRVLNLEMSCLHSAKAQHAKPPVPPESSELRSFLRSPPSFFILTDPEGVLLDQIRHLHRMIKNDYASYEVDAQALLLMAETARQYAVKVRKSKSALSYPVKKALEFIEEAYGQSLTPEELASHAGLSKSHFQRLFKLETGYTVTEKINAVRTEKAAFLLTESTVLITDIAFEVGFNSRQHFFDIFKKTYGCSPQRFRKNKGNEQYFRGWDEGDSV